MSVINVDIVSAEESIFSGQAEMVFAPAEGGEVGILPKHTPMLAQLKPGEVCIRNDANDQYFLISGGFIEIQPDQVVILADTAVRAKDIDEAKIMEAKKKAEEAMENAKSDFDVAKAESELVNLNAQMQALSKLRSKLKTQGHS